MILNKIPKKYLQDKMRMCAVATCKNIGNHKFPNDESQAQQWIKATRINVRKIDWKRRKHSWLCSDHFIPSDFHSRGKQVRLKKTAVPSIFSWTTPVASTSKTEPQNAASNEIYECNFNPANASKNYIRSDTRITFVEEYPILNMEMETIDSDPLRINPSPVPDTVGSKTTIDEDLNVSNLIRNHVSVQTEPATLPQIQQETDLKRTLFSVDNLKNNDKIIHFYTGLETFDKLNYVLSLSRVH